MQQWVSYMFVLLAATLAAPAANASPDSEIHDFDAAIANDAAETESAPTARSPLTGAAVQMRQMNPDISLILDTSFGWFSQDDHLRQGGHAMNENGLAVQGLEFAASASVDPFFRFDLNFELSHLHLEEAYLTTLALPLNMQARMGYLNAQFGRENPLHLHSWHFSNPSLMHSRFMSEEHFSGAGTELSVLAPTPWYLLIVGQVLGTADELGLRSDSFGNVAFTQKGKNDGPEDFVYVARVVNAGSFSDDWALNVGLNGAWGQSPYVPDNRVTLYGADLYLKWRPLSTGDDAMAVGLTAEALVRDTQVPGDSVRDAGGYAALDVQFNRYWIANLRGDYVQTLGGEAPEGSNLQGLGRRASLALSYIPTHFSKLRVQLDVGQEKRLPRYVAGFLQLEVSAGEHGAHSF